MKALKFPNEDKELSIFNERLAQAERKLSTEREETDSEKIKKCAELRHERIMKLAEVMGYDEALAWQRYGVSDYELRCELEGELLRAQPEIRYERRKKRWLDHESSWWARRFTTIPPLTEYDGYGCTEGGCVPSCRFYAPTGRIEDSELKELHAEENRREQEMIKSELTALGFNDNDCDDIKRQKWQQIFKLRSRILDEKLEYMHQTQHVGPSRERLKEIETTAWAEFYENVERRRQKEQL